MDLEVAAVAVVAGAAILFTGVYPTPLFDLVSQVGDALGRPALTRPHLGSSGCMSDKREPEIREDPREQGTGEGYPESNPQEQTPVEGTEQGPEAGAEHPRRGPSVDGHGEDSPPSKATGNPHAAGP